MRSHTKHPSRGFFVILILVFGAIFLLMLTSLTGFVVSQKRASSRVVSNEQALHIAEAGLDYYRWHLAHNPGDITNGTTTAQPYIYRYEDPEGGEIGQFELTVEGTQSSCGYIGAVDITSVGRLDAEPNLPRALYGRYTRPNIAGYSEIVNVNSWVGEEHETTGPYHSNGGINMWGTNNSIVTSAVSTWTCTSSQGCSGSQTKPGVFGTGPNSELWIYPTPPIDFVGLAVDLVDMKAAANVAGRYFGSSNDEGYEVIFKSDGTFDLYQVNTTVGVHSYGGGVRGTEYNIIGSKTKINNYTIREDCPLLFFEDKVWLKGEVDTKVAIAAARPSSSSDPSIILHGNLTYTTDDGSAGIMVIAENNILIALNAPEQTVLNGIFVAQKGAVRRNGYCTGYSCGFYGYTQVPSAYTSSVYLNSLNIYGSIVSNGQIFFEMPGCGYTCSGFNTRTVSYDGRLVDDPPPLIPSTSEDFKYSIWKEVSAE